MQTNNTTEKSPQKEWDRLCEVKPLLVFWFSQKEEERDYGGKNMRPEIKREKKYQK